MIQEKVFIGIFSGLLLLLGLHSIAVVIIYALGLILEKIFSLDGYLAIVIWVIGGGGFFIWQLLYVTPTCMLLNKKRQVDMMKGVIIGAVLTALFNGAVFVFLFSR